MSEWGWVKEPGSFGELPVRILPEGHAECLDISFLDDELVQDVRVELRTLPADIDIRSGDICILKVEIAEVSRSDGVTVGVEVLGAEMVNQAERSGPTVEEMMQHLPEARKIQRERREKRTCANCKSIDMETRLSAEEKVADYDLHHCADCGRLLSTSEYDKWFRLRR